MCGKSFKMKQCIKEHLQKKSLTFFWAHCGRYQIVDSEQSNGHVVTQNKEDYIDEIWR